ncbi:MAG: type II toxin-antitoxin system PemK/MazF family toxin [Candidatus Kapabacteria bacterium]|nr:type II toxin-antitoxin system PemK/MazF family toxin [Candidatus Kapabacteria bacterium]
MIFERGDICIADLNPVQGSEQSGIRPVIIFQNNDIIQYSSTLIIIPFTTNLKRAVLPTCLKIIPDESGLEEVSVALCHQIRVIDKTRIKKKISKLNSTTLFELETTVLLTLGYE